MRVGAAILCVAAIAAAVVWHPWTHPRSNSGACPYCKQDVASATYYVLMQMDCDGESDYGESSACEDELQNVNVAPAVTETVTPKTGDVTVVVKQALSGGGSLTYTILFSATGEFLKAH